MEILNVAVNPICPECNSTLMIYKHNGDWSELIIGCENGECSKYGDKYILKTPKLEISNYIEVEPLINENKIAE